MVGCEPPMRNRGSPVLPMELASGFWELEPCMLWVLMLCGPWAVRNPVPCDAFAARFLSIHSVYALLFLTNSAHNLRFPLLWESASSGSKPTRAMAALTIQQSRAITALSAR